MDAFDDAPTAEHENQASGGKLNFGRLKISPRYLRWENGKPIECDSDTYRKLSGRDRTLEYVFNVDIQEFKPDLQFTYERKVQVGGLEWNKIFRVSLVKLVGEEAVEKRLPDVLRQLHGAYVCVEDVPQIATAKNPDRVKYSTVKLVTKYQSREACYAAWKEKYGSASAAASGSTGAGATQMAAEVNVPIGYSGASWAAMEPDLARLYAKKLVELSNNVAAALVATASEYGAEGHHVAALLGIEMLGGTPEKNSEIPF